MSRFGDDGQYRELSAKMLAGILHLHRGTPYVYQGEELGMTNMSFGAISDYRDIEVLNHHREATTHLGHTDAEVLAALAPLNRDNARTPVQWDASGMAASPPARRGSPSTRTPATSTPRSRRTTRTRCSASTARSSPCGTPNRWWRTGTSPCCSGRRARVRVRPLTAGTELLVLGNFSGEDRMWRSTTPTFRRAWAMAELVLGNYPRRPRRLISVPGN